MYKSHCVYSIISWRTNFAVDFNYFNCSKHQVSLRDVDLCFKLFLPLILFKWAAINICKLFLIMESWYAKTRSRFPFIASKKDTQLTSSSV